jgi:hypothetical protein
MRWFSIVPLILIAAFFPAGSSARETSGGRKIIPTINLTSAEKALAIEVDANTSEIEIGRIIVGRPLHSAAAQIIVTPIKGTGSMARPVSIRIHDIQSTMGGETRLILTLGEKLKVSKLEITRSAARPSDPYVEIAMDLSATLAELALTGGRYRTIMVRPGPRIVEGQPNQPANIAISRVQMADLSVIGGDPDRAQPITMTIDAELTKPLYGVVENTFSFDNVQMRGEADISLNGTTGAGQSVEDVGRCTTAGRVLAFTGARLIVGDPRGRLDGAGKASALALSLAPDTCLTLELTDVSLFGDLFIQGGVLNALALDNVEDHVGGTFRLEFAGLRTLQVGTASLSRVAWNTSSQNDLGTPVIQKWAAVRVQESVALPTSVYDALSASLRSSPNDETSAGIRNFLVDARWKSFSSDGKERRAAPEMLYAVLNSDAQQIFGSPVAPVLWFMTGYGQNLWLPALCISLLLTSPILVAGFLWAAPRVRRQSRPWPRVAPYYSALLAGDNAAILAVDRRLAYLASAHRVLIAVEAGLVALFIQNAVLTGAL